MSETIRDSGRRRRNIRLTVLALVALVIAVVASFIHRVQMPRVMSPSEMQANGFYLLETPRSFGEINLTDHQGKPFTRERFVGHWTLVFFGFTYCPDVCPTTMAFLNDFIHALQGTEAEDTRVVMVSVDPSRDTVEKLATYVPYFNPDFVGVTGDFLGIHRFATALNTPFRKVPGEGDNYTVDHGSNVILINPRGDYHGFFKAPLDIAKMKTTLRSTLVLWERQ